MALFPLEWLTLGFAAACLAGAGRRWSEGDHAPAAAGLSGTVILIVLLAGWTLPAAVRLWLGPVYLAAGYWMPALVRRNAVDARFTAWLIETDARLPQVRQRLSGWLGHVADCCYLVCYPLVPVAYGVLAWHATMADRQRFWVAVLAAGFACYATLPWLVSLPPRRLDANGTVERPLGAVNVAVLQRVSHGFNTFPSGHAAVSTAIALVTIPLPALSLACAAIAAGIAAGAVAGRHHYTVDVLAGVAVGALAAAAAFIAI